MSSLPARLLLAAGLAAFALQWAQVWGFVADDAFITFRYAQNLVGGHGPTWNPGGPQVEGFTSAGYLLLATLPELLGADPVSFARAIGGLAALAMAASAAGVAHLLSGGGEGGTRPSTGPLAAAFAAGGLLAWYPTAVHAASCMETLPAAALLTELLRRHLLLHSGRRPRRGLLAGLSLAVGLLRPELNVVAAALFAYSYRQTPRERTWLAREVGGVWLLPGALFFVARAAWYGHALPLPFHAKIAGGAALPGLDSVLVFAASLLALLGLLAVVGLVGRARRSAAVLGLIGIVVGLGLLPDPVMDFDFRYCMPAAPAAFALAGVGFARLVGLLDGAVNRGGAGRSRVPLALVAVAILCFGAAVVDPAVRSLRDRRAYGQALQTMNVRLGHVLAEQARASGGVPTVALGDVGAIAYYSGATVIDTYSLNDPEIVLGGRHDPGYVLDQRPDFVAVVSTRPREFRAHWANRHDTGLYEACVREGRRPAVILTFSAASYLWVMTRPDSELERALRAEYLGREG